MASGVYEHSPQCGFQKGNKVNLSRKHTEATKKKMREAKMGKKNPMFGQVEELKRRGLKGLIIQQNSKEPTSIEKKVYNELKSRHLLFETQKLINGKFLVDAYIPSLNLIIEADGDYWHNLDRVKKKDKAENAYLDKCGYNMLRLSETEINNGNYINTLNQMEVN